MSGGMVEVEIESDEDLQFDPVDLLEQSTYEGHDTASITSGEVELTRNFTRDPINYENTLPQPQQESVSKPNARSFPCIHCSSVFTCRTYLRNHMIRIFGKNVCRYCYTGYASEEALKSHLKTAHDPERPYKCEICAKTFRSQVGCDIHSKRHRNGECVDGRRGRRIRCRTRLAGPNFSCAQCSRRFPTKKLLRAHKCKRGNASAYICDICGEGFAAKPTLARHLLAHAQPMRFECAVCGAMFPSRRKRDTHRATHAEKHARHVCHVCLHTFPSRYHVAKHLVTHEKEGISTARDSSRTPAPPQGDVDGGGGGDGAGGGGCDGAGGGAGGGGVRDAGDVVRVYVVEETRTCGECGQLFVGADAWAEHANAHVRKAPRTPQIQYQSYKCEVCEKEFTQNYYLKLHRRTHTGERPYACEMCDKGFTTSSKLTRHTRSHLGIKQYPCETCKKAFTRASYLRLHMSKHCMDSRGAAGETEASGFE